MLSMAFVALNLLLLYTVGLCVLAPLYALAFFSNTSLLLPLLLPFTGKHLIVS